MSTQAPSAVAAPIRGRDHSALPVPLLAVAGILGLAHLPLLIAHGYQLWLREHYQLFPIVLIFAGILAVPAYRAAMAAPSGPGARRVGFGLLALNWLLLALAIVVNSPKLGAFSFLELLLAVAVVTGGKRTFLAAVPALLYLLVIIPPPFNLDVTLITGLQSFTARCASRVLDEFGVYHALNGVVVESAGKFYEIEKACSGISSLLSIFACTLFYVLWTRPHWLRGILLVLAAVFWVLMNNVTRVVTIVFFDTRFEFDLTRDVFPLYLHTLLGIVLFAITLGLVWSTDKLLQFMGSAVKWGDKQAKVRPPLRPTGEAPLSLSWGSIAPIGLAYGLLIVFQAAEYGLSGHSVSESQITQAYNAFNASTMPDKLVGWQKIATINGFSERNSDNLFDPLGAHSRTWKYVRGNLIAIVSFDYPFPAFHDLRVCYTSTGWAVADSTYFNVPFADKSADLECVRAVLTRPIERTAYLMFGEFDPNGKPIAPAELGMADVRFTYRFGDLRDRWARLFGGKEGAQVRSFQVLQVQVLLEAYSPLNDSETNELKNLFVASMEHLRGKCLEAVKSAGKQ